MSLSAFLMRLATHRPPPAHADWARAMQAEFEVLERGRLSWALGCLATSTSWRLKSLDPYPLAVPALVLLTYVLINPLFMVFAWPDCGVRCLGNPGVYLFGEIPMIATCMALGAVWPSRAVLTGVLAAGTLLAAAYAVFALAFHSVGAYVHFADRPPVVGELILLAGCTLSALLGAGLRAALKTLTAYGPA